jgi:hypothetical protein
VRIRRSRAYIEGNVLLSAFLLCVDGADELVEMFVDTVDYRDEEGQKDPAAQQHCFDKSVLIGSSHPGDEVLSW